MAIAKVRRVDGYGNNSRQQLEDIITTPSPSFLVLVQIPSSSPRFRPRVKTRYQPIYMPRPRLYSRVYEKFESKTKQNFMWLFQSKNR